MHEALVPVAAWVKQELESCLDFWLKYGRDRPAAGHHA